MPLEFFDKKRARNRFGNVARQREGDPFNVLLRDVNGNVSPVVEFHNLIEAIHFVDEAADMDVLRNGTIEIIWNGHVIATFQVDEY